MNYIAEINAFERWLETNYLPISSQLLWYKLMALCNRCGWSEWVTVDNQRLMATMSMGREATFINSRDKLIKAGLIEYQKGKKGSPNKYKIITFTFKSVVQSVVQSEVQSVVYPVVKTEVQTVDINKLNETKPDNTTTATACEEVFGTAMAYFMDKICPTPSGAMVPDLERYAATMSADVIIRAMDKGLEAGAANWNYINKILSNWEKAGVKTMADVAREAERRERSKPSGKGGVNQRGDDTRTDRSDGIDWDNLDTVL